MRNTICNFEFIYLYMRIRICAHPLSSCNFEFSSVKTYNLGCRSQPIAYFYFSNNKVESRSSRTMGLTGEMQRWSWVRFYHVTIFVQLVLFIERDFHSLFCRHLDDCFCSIDRFGGEESAP